MTLDEWSEFNDLKDKFEGKGTKLFSPYRQDTWDKPYWSTNDAKFWMVGPEEGIATSSTREIHDACSPPRKGRASTTSNNSTIRGRTPEGWTTGRLPSMRFSSKMTCAT